MPRATIFLVPISVASTLDARLTRHVPSPSDDRCGIMSFKRLKAGGNEPVGQPRRRTLYIAEQIERS